MAKEYRMNGSAAYEISVTRESTAQPLRKPRRLPDAKVYFPPEKKEKVKLQILHDMAEPSPDGIEPPSTSQPIQRCVVIKLPMFTQEKIEIDIIYS